MIDIVEKTKEGIVEAIRDAAHSDAPKADLLEYPTDPKNGDIAFPCFVLARELKKSPPAIAAELVESLKLPAGVESVAAAGPYLNFTVSDDFLVRATAYVRMKGGHYGFRDRTRRKAVVEYVSPNNNKPLHLGHIRCGLVGESVANLMETQGDGVVRTLLLNDRGLAIAKSMVAYMRWGEGMEPQEKGMKGDRFVGDMYVRFDKEAKSDPSLEEAAHEVIRKWEDGDEETRALWKKLDAWAVEGQEESYRKLGLHFDTRYRESDVYRDGKTIVEEGLKKGVFERDETGAVMARLEDEGLQDKVVLRSDGTALYITQDMALAKRKEADHAPDLSVIVTANEQILHFRQLFAILKKLGYGWADRQQHLAYGYVSLPEGRMKSREGNVVEADDLVDALDADAAMEITQRHPKLDGQELVTRAHQLAMGALKFHFLQVDASQDMVFNPKESLSFNGRTGPYVQYMYARTRSIMRKAEVGKKKGLFAKLFGKGERLMTITAPEEKSLAFMLARYPETLTVSATELRPSVLANHLYETARALAAFYEKCPVISEEDESSKAFRLALVEATGIVLRNGLAVLGIDAPEEM